MTGWPKDDIVGIPLHDPIYRASDVESYREMEGIIYKDARLLIHTFMAPEETIRDLLPEELSPGGLNLIVALIAEYPVTSLGPYKEAALFVTAQYGDTVGMHCPYMFIDELYGDHSLGADLALILGRESLGFPKTLAKIELAVEGTRYTGTVRRKGGELMRIEAELDEPGDFPDMGTMINVRSMPTPALDGYSYRDICCTNLEYKPSISIAGEGKVLFPASHAAMRSVQVEEDLASFYTVTDFCIPRGETLAVLEGGGK
ncbi:MAG: acetoacetate decarboxylase family protein [Firmicutes bacterium]|nr:acetoacetate decarboxylase family protein [Bacillota bacterium]